MNLNLLKILIKKDFQDETLEKINQHLYKEYNKPLTYTQEPSHSPSTLGTKCFRKIYYQFFRVEKDVFTDAKGARIFETGKNFENMVMDWLKGIGEHIAYRNKGNGQIPLDRDGSGRSNPQFPISSPSLRIKRGYIDNVSVINGKLWLYEIKSSNSYKFETLIEPIPEHIIQITCYFKAFNDHLAAGDFSHIPELQGINKVTGVKVLYVNKNDSEIKLFTLEESQLEEELDILENKVKIANNYIDLHQLPAKTPDKCSYCPYIKKCRKDFNPF